MQPAQSKRIRLLAISAAAVVLFALLTWHFGSSFSHSLSLNFGRPDGNEDQERPANNLDQKPNIDLAPPAETPEPRPDYSPGHHPIDELISNADIQFGWLLSKQKYSVNDAAAAYRTARGRHPPPGWAKYVEWCEENEVLMIEDFYDPMYRDLAPFWSVPAETMRVFPQQWHRTLSIRDGKVRLFEYGPPMPAKWIFLWEAAVNSLPVADLPDVDFAFNLDDEPKLFPSHETVSKAVASAEADRLAHVNTPLSEIDDDFGKLGKFNKELSEAASEDMTFKWSERPASRPLWDVVRDSCPPDTPGSTAESVTDFTTPMDWTAMSNASHLQHGFVKDWRLSKSACANPEIRNIHGTFIAMRNGGFDQPKDMRDRWAIIHDLVPLISGCKISGINADILIPPAVEFEEFEGTKHGYAFNSANATAWHKKESRFIWRGAGSGGWHADNNWTRFHRQRLVAMLNSSLVSEHYRAREWGKLPPEHVPGLDQLPYNFAMPSTKDPYSLSHLWAPKPVEAVKTWLGEMSPEDEAGFTHMLCGNHTLWFAVKSCFYMDASYKALENIPMDQQFQYKYLPDIDGNSYSGRFLGFLQSNSLPIKASIYDEWHDGRLVAWKHFVPMDNSFMDLYGILEYFAGYDAKKIEGAEADESRGRSAHDEEAEKIAMQGTEWAERALRKVDRLAYIYRLILEMARLSDERRLKMGWVDDLKEGNATSTA
jgi:hypothetical protein